MNNKMRKIRNLKTIYDQVPILNSLNSTLEQIDKLNTILHDVIPESLVQFCHFGAIDSHKNQVVLFTNNQHAFNLLRNLSSHIMEQLSIHNYRFDTILVRTYPKKYKINKHEAMPPLDNKQIAALKKLAKIIGKPDLVKPKPQPKKPVEKEIDF